MTAFPETIPELFAWRAAQPSATWLFYESDCWTYGDVADLVDRVAVGLAERGVVHGDRIAILLPNHPRALFTWFAANRLGAIACFVNPAQTPFEVAAFLRLARPRVLVADEHEALAEVASAALPDGARPIIASTAELGQRGRGAPEVAVTPDDVAVLIATSGTTGAPKAVAQTHRTYTLTAEAFPAWLGLDASDRLLVALPLFHINAQAYSTLGALGAGASLALVPKFSASRFFKEAKRLAATQVNAVGAMVHILAAAEARPSDRDHQLRTLYAALALPEAQHRAFEDRFGLRMLVGYGMSETTFGTIWPRELPPRYGSMGTLRQHPRLGEINRARVVRADGTDAADGEAGELWLQNPGSLREYFGSSAETALTLAGGWLHTGDLVRRDADGFFTFVARMKELIRRRGENISAAEIELAMLAHPSVGQAAAIAAPSALGEDEIVAYVAARAGATLDPEALRDFLRTRLAEHKLPSVIHVRASLPRTATERIAKHLLK
ncbi:MAG: AMP-binding protein [Myxococcales bacterium]|nr:AMP-binding protein [Myxococcales bacterium]